MRLVGVRSRCNSHRVTFDLDSFALGVEAKAAIWRTLSEPPSIQHSLPGCHRLNGDGALVWIHPDHDPAGIAHAFLLLCRHRLLGAGGHRFYQQSIPFFSLSRPAAAGAAHAK